MRKILFLVGLNPLSSVDQGMKKKVNGKKVLLVEINNPQCAKLKFSQNLTHSCNFQNAIVLNYDQWCWNFNPLSKSPFLGFLLSTTW